MTKQGSAVTYRPQKYVCTITFVLQMTHFFKKSSFFGFIFTKMTIHFLLYDKPRNNRSCVRIFPLLDFIKKKGSNRHNNDSILTK